MNANYIESIFFYLLQNLASNKEKKTLIDTLKSNVSKFFKNRLTLDEKIDNADKQNNAIDTVNYSRIVESNLRNKKSTKYAENILKCLSLQPDFVKFIQQAKHYLMYKAYPNTLIENLWLIIYTDSPHNRTVVFNNIYDSFELHKNQGRHSKTFILQDFLQFLMRQIDKELAQFSLDNHLMETFKKLFIGDICNYNGMRDSEKSYRFCFHENFYHAHGTIQETIDKTLKDSFHLRPISERMLDNYQIFSLPERIILPITNSRSEDIDLRPFTIVKKFQIDNVTEFGNCSMIFQKTIYELDAFITQTILCPSGAEQYHCYCKKDGIWSFYNGQESQADIIDLDHIGLVLENNSIFAMLFYSKNEIH